MNDTGKERLITASLVSGQPAPRAAMPAIMRRDMAPSITPAPINESRLV
jgi:hypothetical protein